MQDYEFMFLFCLEKLLAYGKAVYQIQTDSEEGSQCVSH